MTRSAATLARLVLISLLGIFVVGSPAQSKGPLKTSPIAAPILARLSEQESQPPRFRTGIEVVAVDVCVKGRNGQFVPGLSADDFLVLENNAPQKVAFFSAEERVPLAVVLLIDRSQSMRGSKLDRAKAAAGAFLRTLRPDDLVEAIAFNDRASRLFSLSPLWRVERDSMSEAIADLSASGTTGLYEAVTVGLRDLARAQGDRATDYRSAIVVLSDGEDTSSTIEFDDVLEGIRRSGVLVYAISLRTDQHDRWLAPLRELAQFAYDSGGQAVAVRTLESLAPVYQEIGTELRHLYRLAYTPSPSVQDGRWHPISVRVPGKDVRVRARAGYYAARPPLGLAQDLGGKP